MLTGEQVRERLNIGKKKFLKLVRTGELDAIKTGDAPNSPYRVSEESLGEFIRTHKVVPGREAVNQ